MVDFIEDPANQTCLCVSDKIKTEVTIKKSLGNNSFFEIHYASGSVPQQLAGRYTTMKTAKDAVQQYLDSIRKSSAVRRDEFAAEREKRKNASKSEPKGS